MNLCLDEVLVAAKSAIIMKGRLWPTLMYITCTGGVRSIQLCIPIDAQLMNELDRARCELESVKAREAILVTTAWMRQCGLREAEYARKNWATERPGLYPDSMRDRVLVLYHVKRETDQATVVVSTIRREPCTNRIFFTNECVSTGAAAGFGPVVDLFNKGGQSCVADLVVVKNQAAELGSIQPRGTEVLPF